MIKLNINGVELTGYSGQTILEIATENGIDIPTMCYDDRLETYGACGLCVVEILGSPKLARACATKAMDGMVVDTMSKKVVASRKTALELLMTDHVGDCKAPCQLACPGQTDCQGYAGLIAMGELEEAIITIKDQLPMPACIGRVCPHPCETACRRGLVEEPIAIASLKYFAADMDLKSEAPYMPQIESHSGKKIAIVGGGPGGLSAGYFLRQYGHDITVFEAMDKMGGMLRYGIPEYRLPKAVVDSEVKIFVDMGIKMKNNMRMGEDFTLEELRRDYDAVIVATGAWKSSPLRCEGEELSGVIGGIELLEKVNSKEKIDIGDRVAIVGGGNTAMDACRTAVRLGAKEVYNIYRRTKDEMPAEEIEIIEGEEEGVIFKYLVNPIKLNGENGKVTSMLLQKMTLGEPDASGRRKPIPLEGETELLEVDSVITAIGQKLNAQGHGDIALTAWGTIAADERTFMTNLDGVFAIGDATNDGADIAITAIGEAKRLTNVVHTYMTSTIEPSDIPFHSVRKDVKAEEFAFMPKQKRVKMPHHAPEKRKHNFEEVNLGLTLEMAKKEGARCLECGCLDVYDCSLINYSRQYKITPESIEGERHHRSVDNPHPFIKIDQDKCILCGQCVRTCDEVLGIGALGLSDRGFDTIMQPAFNLPLTETDCISCGQCVSVCPTGALQERLSLKKSVPLPPERIETTCDKCGVGCQIEVNVKGDQIVRAESMIESPVDDGQLCVRGRFGHVTLDAKKITTPLILKEGKHVEISWEQALDAISTQLKPVMDKGKEDAVAICASDRYTNEAIYSLKHLATDIIHTQHITSMSAKDSPLIKVTGQNGSMNTFDELNTTDVMLVAGTNVYRDYPVIGMKIRKAVKEGVKLLNINTQKTIISEWANHEAVNEDFESTILGVLKACLDQKNQYAQLPEQLKAKLDLVTVTEDIADIAKCYTDAKNSIIVFDSFALSDIAIVALGVLAKVSGHIGRARNGIIELHAGANTQGLRDLGLGSNQQEVVAAINKGQVDVLMLFGEQLKPFDLSKVTFSVVQDIYYDETMADVDLILPAQTFERMEGTFTSSQRRIGNVNTALVHEQYPSVVEIVNGVLTRLNKGVLSDVQTKMAQEVEGYQSLLNESTPSVYTHNNKRILPVILPSDQDVFSVLNECIHADQTLGYNTSYNGLRLLLDTYLIRENIL